MRVGGAVRPGAVGWWIGDVAVMRHLRLVGTIPRGTEALDRAGSWTPWRRVCTRLAQGHPANVARYGGVATSLGRTYGYRRTADHMGCGVQHSMQFLGRRFPSEVPSKAPAASAFRRYRWNVSNCGNDFGCFRVNQNIVTEANLYFTFPGSTGFRCRYLRAFMMGLRCGIGYWSKDY